MLQVSDESKKSRALRKLHEILERAVEGGADSVELEYADSGLEVTFMFGTTGLGGVLVERELEGEVIGLIVQKGHLQKKPRGAMSMMLLGEAHTITIEEYEEFGESGFRLKLKKVARQVFHDRLTK